MKQALMDALWTYIIHNNPDLMLALQQRHAVTEYLEGKMQMIIPYARALQKQAVPQDSIERICLDKMTAKLRPSRFLYIRSVIAEEFPLDYDRLIEEGTLTNEVVMLVQLCKQIFDDYNFSVENQENRYLRYAVIAEVHNFLS